ncbi:unnamed protein product [Lathyrus oleraceus]
MVFIMRLSLLGLLLIYAAQCSARNTPKDIQNVEFEIDDYGKPGSNPRHDPHPPPSRPPLDTQNIEFEIDDYDKPEPNPRHDPQLPPFGPPPVKSKMQ